MPFTFTIDMRKGVVSIHGVGVIRPDDVRVVLDDLATAGVACIPLLIDLRDVMVRFFPEEVQACVEYCVLHQAHYGAVRCAAIAGDHATYGVLYMYQSLSAERGPGFRIFLTLPKALEWLQQDDMQPRSASRSAQGHVAEGKQRIATQYAAYCATTNYGAFGSSHVTASPVAAI